MKFTDKLCRRRTRPRLAAVRGAGPGALQFPGAWRGDPARIFDFCATIVDATQTWCCAFKPQIAYFAAQRAEDQLERLMAHIRKVAPNVPVILDAKRGDIGSTAEQYALRSLRALPGRRGDALAVHGLRLGRALAAPRRTRACSCCAAPPTPAARDLQAQRLVTGDLLYEHIARLAQGPWNRTRASSAWWSAPPDRPRSPACASSRRRCRC